jgi:hypothetical protein
MMEMQTAHPDQIENRLDNEEHEGGDLARPSGGNLIERALPLRHVADERHERAYARQDGAES